MLPLEKITVARSSSVFRFAAAQRTFQNFARQKPHQQRDEPFAQSGRRRDLFHQNLSGPEPFSGIFSSNNLVVITVCSLHCSADDASVSFDAV